MIRKKLALLLSVVAFTAASSALPVAAEDKQEEKPAAWDPIEPVNRGTFWFNDQFDYYLLEPVSSGYNYVMPEVAQEGVNNFFMNLRYPSYLVSDIVQFKFDQVVDHTGRFLINSTIGLLGLIDVAKHVGLPDHEEDFGIALAYQGVPPGPYIVLPFIGPSNLRDTVGFVVDTAINPLQLFTYTDAHSDAKLAVSTGGTALKAVQTRVNYDEAIKTGKEASLDYYLFLQSAYYQYREGLVTDGKPPVDPSLSEDPDAPSALNADPDTTTPALEEKK